MTDSPEREAAPTERDAAIEVALGRAIVYVDGKPYALDRREVAHIVDALLAAGVLVLPSAVAAVREENERLDADNLAALTLMTELLGQFATDAAPCRYDHDGWCQTHLLNHEPNNCPMPRYRAIFAEWEPALAATDGSETPGVPDDTGERPAECEALDCSTPPITQFGEWWFCEAHGDALGFGTVPTKRAPGEQVGGEQ